MQWPAITDLTNNSTLSCQEKNLNNTVLMSFSVKVKLELDTKGFIEESLSSSKASQENPGVLWPWSSPWNSVICKTHRRSWKNYDSMPLWFCVSNLILCIKFNFESNIHIFLINFLFIKKTKHDQVPLRGWKRSYFIKFYIWLDVNVDTSESDQFIGN